MSTAIWWVRRDLRLDNNPTLRRAVETGLFVQPVFILDPALLNDDAPPRQSFLMEGLAALNALLRQRGSYLLLRHGEPIQQLALLARELEASIIFAEEDYTPYARRRDAVAAQNLPIQWVTGLTALHPASVVKADGSPYTVFTPFMKAWKSMPSSLTGEWKAPAKLAGPALIESHPIPSFKKNTIFPATQPEAEKRLERFIDDGLFSYAESRDRLDLDGTSSLSPYLRFGLISIRQLFAAAEQAKQQAPDSAATKSAETWMNELIWREFYQSILYHFPFVTYSAFNPRFRAIPWRDAPQDLLAWQQGRTGFPVVDAAMRQLSTIGWVHNRARMIAASFLAKDLLINWQEGERWFFNHLVDADIAANNGGWQWTAGVGTDAAPYFRVFNPTLQGIKFDPEGNYIRRWVPELANLPTKLIHQPELMTALEETRFNVRLGRDYPRPIIDRSQTRERTLNAYQLSKDGFTQPYS